MRIAHLDCFSGISGDMLIGALIDVGANQRFLIKALEKIPLKDYKINIKKVMKGGISATKFTVISKERSERNLDDIFNIIDKSQFDKDITTLSKKIFMRIATAESKIHGIPINKVHFHEIGAIDSIIDILSVLILINELGIEYVSCSDIPLGNGFVRFSHGKWPVPTPAVLELLKGIPTYQSDIVHELVTPTGAGILSVIANEFGNMPKMRLESVGYGAGSDELNIPNVLRLLIGDKINSKEEIQTEIIETNVDNMNPEYYSYLMDRLFEDGALDVFFTNIYMKKNRPGVKITVLSSLDKTDKLANIILQETTALGLRIYPTKRICLERRFCKIDTKYGKITLKIAEIGNKIINVSPEYEDCARISKKNRIPLKEIYDIALREYNLQYNGI